MCSERNALYRRPVAAPSVSESADDRACPHRLSRFAGAAPCPFKLRPGQAVHGAKPRGANRAIGVADSYPHQVSVYRRSGAGLASGQIKGVSDAFLRFQLEHDESPVVTAVQIERLLVELRKGSKV
jgi:hypothetical protein